MPLGQILGLRQGIDGVGVIHILVRTKEGGKFIRQLHLEALGQLVGVPGAADVLEHRDLIAAVSVGQGEYGPLPLLQIVCIGGGGSLDLGLQTLGGLGGVLHHHIAVFGVGIVNNGFAVLFCVF